MTGLQPAVKVFIAVLLSLAVGLTLLAHLRSGPVSRGAILVAVIATGCMALAWLFPIHIAAQTKLYPDTAVVIGSLLLLPPALATVAVGCGTLMAHVMRRDARDWAQALFNTAQIMLVALAAASLLAAAGWEPDRPSFANPWLMSIILIAGVVMYILNALLVSAVTMLQTRESLAHLVPGALTGDLSTELVAHISLVATGTLAAMAALAYQWGAALLLIPIAATYITLKRQAELRHAAEQARIMSDASLAEAQRLAHLGSWEWDPRGDRWAWSDEVYRIMGMKPGATGPGTPALLAATHPDDRDRVAKALSDARRDGASFEIEHRVQPLDGAERVVQQRGVSRPESEGAPRFLGTIQDVTERVRAADAMRAAREAAEDATRAKTQLLAMASHDLRTPLSAIRGYLDIVMDGSSGDLTAEQREFLEGAHRNTLQIASLVDDLLDLGRIEAGALALGVGPVSIDTVVQEVLGTVAPQAAEKGLRLERVAGPSSPVALADAGRLRQTLLNLVANAVKFTDAGSVTVSTREYGSWVEIAVSDTGVGITPKALPHVFEEFNQGSEAAGRRGGSGLGLAIVKKLIELQGGSVAAHSVPGKGSTFTLRLPAAKAVPVSREPVA